MKFKSNYSKVFIIVLVLVLMMISGCKKEEKPTEPVDTRSNAEISESAMNNFINKIEAANYVVDCPTFVKATVTSKDVVTFEYVYKIDYLDYNYDGISYMTVNDNETFYGYLTDDDITLITFLGEDKAIDMASIGTYIPDVTTNLPNFWLLEEISEGNVWNLFYNDQENPLRFVSNHDAIKQSVKFFASVGNLFMSRMQDVVLVLDKEDPNSATLTTSFSEGYPALDDIVITITFGNAQVDNRVSEWVNNPNRSYPEARTSWGVDIMDINAVFLPGYGETALPFPSFATYAFTLDVSRILSDDEVLVRDCKATREDMQNYANSLKSKGFREVLDDGKVYYRLLLREDYKCYSSIYLEYDNGVNIVARKWYAYPTYSTLSEINELLASHGFEALIDSNDVSILSAKDTTNELIESWLYFFGYDLVLYVNLGYDSKELAQSYINGYIDLLADYVPTSDDEEESYYDDEDYAALKALVGDIADSDNTYYLKENDECIMSFRYHYSDDGKLVTLLFKSEKYVDADEAKELVVASGFPTFDEDKLSSCRDMRKFQKTMYGRDTDLDYSMSFTFDTIADAQSFLDSYIGALRDDSFDITSPSSAEVNKAMAYVKETEEKLYVFALDYTGDSSQAFIEFRVIDNE